MLIVMKKGATVEQVERVAQRVRELGWMPQAIAGSTRTVIGITGNPGAVSPDPFLTMDGVVECLPVSRPYRHVSREIHPEQTIVDVREARVGDGGLHIFAGPCSVESRDQIMRTAEAVAASGAKFLRGGAFKPRTSPYSFQGMKEEGLRLLADVKQSYDLRIMTEAKDTESLAAVAEVADVVQIGARNMQNFSLLEAAGRLRMPVLLKRGIGSTLHELFMAAEYLMSHGNHQVMLCERGIRTFETMTRNTFDISAIVMIKHHTHLPVIADPSHGVGIDWAVPPLARASVVAGADGLMVEAHPDPSRALSDGQQALTLAEYAKLAEELKSLAAWRTETLQSRDR